MKKHRRREFNGHDGKRRRSYGGECGRVSLFIFGKSRLRMFQVPFWFPGVIFCGESLPLDQEGTVGRSSAVAQNLFNFIFLFAFDKVRRWFREIQSMDGIFAIGR